MKKFLALLTALFTFKKGLFDDLFDMSMDESKSSQPKPPTDAAAQARTALIRLSTDTLARMRDLEDDSAEYERQLDFLVGYIGLKQDFDKITAAQKHDLLKVLQSSAIHFSERDDCEKSKK